MQAMNSEVIGVGAATRDRLVLVDEFPAGEGVTEVLATATDGGGPVATALCVMERLGHRCHLVDAVGEPAESVILVRRRDGARHILFERGVAREPGAEVVKALSFAGVRLVHVNGRHEAAAREAVQSAGAMGVKVSFDGGAGRYRESIRDLVEASQVLILARTFAEQYAGVEDLQAAAEVLLTLP
jgi:sugar/nucleoside kinase (ribokinase family)